MSTSTPTPITSVSDLPEEARGGPVSNALTRVARLHRMGTARLLREVDLFPGQEVVMMILWEGAAVRQSELIRRTRLDPSTITKMLQRLEQAGHVRRFPDPADGRASLVEATAQSCELRAGVTQVWEDMEKSALSDLDADDQAQLARLLEKVGSNLATAMGIDAPTTGPEVCLVSGEPLPTSTTLRA